MPLRDPRTLGLALADLIESRQNKAHLPTHRALLDRMIDDLEIEISRRRRIPHTATQSAEATDKAWHCGVDDMAALPGGEYIKLT
jgi:hypothetical protein